MKIAILKERRPHETRVAATPETVKKLKALGVEEIVIETGAGVVAAYTDEAYAEAKSRSEAEQLCFIHPFDDPEVIAGQGTVGMEILRQCHQPPDAIYVAVGGEEAGRHARE